MRSTIISPDGYSVFNGDLSNIEIRVLAYYLYKECGDSTLLNWFLNDIDVHQQNADAWGVDRDQAKTAIYTIIYGGGEHTLSNRMSTTRAEAKHVMENIYESLPLQHFKDKTYQEAEKYQGTVRTLFGRPLYYPEMLSSKISVRREGERKVFNSKIQGTAADILKLLTIEVAPVIWLADGKLAAAVHDEILGYVPSTNAELLCEALTYLFSTSDLIAPVPIKADFKHAQNWRDAH